MSGPRAHDPEQGRREAAQWLARRDRGLSAAEQDAYLQWLRERPEHVMLMAEQEVTLGRLMSLAEWRPELSSDPDPDLFAPASRLRRFWLPLAALAAAVAAALGLFVRQHRPQPVPAAVPSHLVAIEPTVLADGSRIEARDFSGVDTRKYSRTQRHLALVGGEAAFTVMKDPEHPFIVEAAGVAVRAVGTVFDVQLGAGSVSVLVSEGKVRVDHGGGEPLYVSAGERAVVPLAGGAQATLARLDGAEVADDLAWRSPRFQFFETPLGDAIGEFNRRNRAQIALADLRLGDRRIGGTFRADNVAGFVRMLESTMGLAAAPDRAGGYVLSAAR